MNASSTETARGVTVLTRNVRLHEWVAIQDGLFARFGLSPRIAYESRLASPDIDGSHPRMSVFDGGPACASASDWGAVRKAHLDGLRIIDGVHGIVRGAVMVPADSAIHAFADLVGRRIGTVLNAGAYYRVQEMVAGELPGCVVHLVQCRRGERAQAFAQGAIDAAVMMEPELSVAAQTGYRTLVEFEVYHLNYVTNGVPDDLVAAYVDVLRHADAALRADPSRYLPLWAYNMSPSAVSSCDFSKFGLGEELRFEAYPVDRYHRCVDFLQRRGLLGDVSTRPLNELQFDFRRTTVDVDRV